MLEGAITNPVEKLLDRNGKQLRAEAVHAAAAMLQPDSSEQLEKSLALGAAILEMLHAASLVVDDIQDNSAMRRGAPTMHREHGVPLALNAGNWLYFFPLLKVRELNLAPSLELQVIHDCHQTLLRGHYGQALDLAFGLDRLGQDDVYAVCRATMELKSGALMQQAFHLGARIAAQHGSASGNLARVERKILALGDFGRRYGVCLQMLNDVGNLTAVKEPEKKNEDLLLRRPSWVWAVAAKELLPESYARFLARLENIASRPAAFEKFIAQTEIAEHAKQLALQELEQAVGDLLAEFSAEQEGHKSIVQLTAKLAGAYE
jgi:geranylgeranyl pyrophosphate synthase